MLRDNDRLQSDIHARHHMTERDRRAYFEMSEGSGIAPDWFTDLRYEIEQGLVIPEPTMLIRDDGSPVITAGTHVSIYGSPGTGKTLLAKFLAAELITQGKRALHIDIDQNLPSILIRDVMAFGVTQTQLLDYWALAQPETIERLHAIRDRILGESDYDLVVIDSVAGLEALTGADGNAALDYVRDVFLGMIAPLTAAGTTVITIDHTPKDATSKGAAGSVQKLAKSDLGLHLVVPDGSLGLVPGQNGSVAVYVEKDRYGAAKALCRLSESHRGVRALLGTFEVPAAGLHYATFKHPLTIEYDF